MHELDVVTIRSLAIRILQLEQERDQLNELLKKASEENAALKLKNLQEDKLV
jgi:hypothetical protein